MTPGDGWVGAALLALALACFSLSLIAHFLPFLKALQTSLLWLSDSQ
jgi:hypothetical protein